ncbi:hypothetical protein Tco_0616395 [Tanacetum coccineum]
MAYGPTVAVTGTTDQRWSTTVNHRRPPPDHHQTTAASSSDHRSTVVDRQSTVRLGQRLGQVKSQQDSGRILKRYWEILPKEVFEEMLGDTTQRDIKEILGDTTQIDIEEILGDTTQRGCILKGRFPWYHSHLRQSKTLEHSSSYFSSQSDVIHALFLSPLVCVSYIGALPPESEVLKQYVSYWHLGTIPDESLPIFLRILAPFLNIQLPIPEIFNVSWAYAFHQDKASLVRVPIANVTLSSLAHLLRENTDSNLPSGSSVPIDGFIVRIPMAANSVLPGAVTEISSILQTSILRS